MKKKIVGICVMTLMIATAVLPAVGTINETEDRNILSVGGPYIEWEFMVGGPYDDFLNGIYQTDDGGYITTGITEDPEGVFSGWIFKLDQFGNEEWRTYETEIQGTNIYTFGITDVHQTHDGGYIVTGACERLEDLKYGFLWKLNADGETEWLNSAYSAQVSGNWYVAAIWDVIPVVNGYIITGGALFCGDMVGDVDAVLMKTDLNGDVVWEQVYRYGEYHDEGHAICSTLDGGFLIVGHVNCKIYGLTSPDDSDIWIIKTDAEGNMEWENTYGGAYDEWTVSRDVFQTTDGGYIANIETASYNVDNPHQDWNAMLLKVDENGNELWNKTYGERDHGDSSFGMDMASDGGYVLAMIKNHAGMWAPRDDMLLVKTDDDGNVEWSQTYGGDRTDRSYNARQTSDEGFVMCGTTASFSEGGDWDGIILKYSAFENQRPNKPTCKYDRASDKLVVSATDPDGDQIRYSVDWENDGIIDQWTELLDSGVEVSIDCEERTDTAGVTAEDEHGGQSDCISVKSISKPYINTPFLRFLEQHQYLFLLLRQILGLK